MEIKSLVCLFIIFIAIIIMLCNRKINCCQLVKDAFNVFRNYKNGKVYWFDLLTFFGCPFVISISVIISFDYCFNKEMANTLLNVFSIMFTLLFGITSILTSTVEGDNEINKKISREAFATASFSMLISLLNLIILILYINLLDFELPITVFMHMSGVVIGLSLLLTMLFLMMIKRSYITTIYNKENGSVNNSADK